MYSAKAPGIVHPWQRFAVLYLLTLQHLNGLYRGRVTLDEVFGFEWPYLLSRNCPAAAVESPSSTFGEWLAT
jgi:hypothetical protein